MVTSVRAPGASTRKATTPSSSAAHQAKRMAFCGRTLAALFQQCRRARTVVVDAGSVGDAVEMGAGHHDVVTSAPASSASWALVPKVQVPLWISAMSARR